MFEKTGIPAQDQVLAAFPSAERLKKGPVAVIECFQKIPCDPCESSCPTGAIVVGKNINDLPRFDAQKCSGCALCIAKCPGRAIMVLDGSKHDAAVEMKIPYEFLPLPKPGDMVRALDRAGNHVADVEVLRVQNPPAFDRTPVVTLLVPNALAAVVRHIETEG